MVSSVINHPLVSVVIPVKDRAIELERALRSIAAQTYTNLEILVVENNSSYPESVRSVTERFAATGARYFHLEQCKNANVARNFGVSKSQGAFVAFLDSDDEFEPIHIETCVALITKESCSFVYGSITVDDSEEQKVKLARDLYPDEHGTEYLFGRRQAWAQTGTYLCRSNVFEDVQWDNNLSRHQDFDFFIKVVDRFKSKCNTNPTVLVHWPANVKRDVDFESFEIFARRWVPAMSRYAAIFFCAQKVKTCLTHFKFGSATLFLNLLVRRCWR